MDRGLTKRAAAAAAGAAALAVVLQTCAALGAAFAAHADEAFLVSVARNLRLFGAYASPGPFGGPLKELPAWPLFLAPFTALDGFGHWRWIGLAVTLSASLLAWLAARRVLAPGPAAAVGAAAALCPATVGLAGSVITDAPFAALAFGAFLLLPEKRAGSKALAACAAVVAVASLIRPHGALLAVALACGVWRASGARRAGAFLAASLAPTALWTLRNVVVAGGASAYLTNFGAQADYGPGTFLVQLYSVAAHVLGRGALGLMSAPDPLAAAAGAVLAWSAWRGFESRRKEPVVLALGVFAGLVVALHASWRFGTPRYALPLLVPLYVLAAAGFETLEVGPRRSALVGAGLCALFALKSDAALARAASWPPSGPVLERVAGWMRSSTAGDARFESVACAPLQLMGERPTLCSFSAKPREVWLSGLAERGVSYVHEPAGWRPDGFFPPAMSAAGLDRARWLSRSGRFERVFTDPVDGDVWRMKPLDAARLKKAVESFVAAPGLARTDPERAKALLEEATRLEPTFANAWAIRALLEDDRAKARGYMEKAAAADPDSADIALELKRLND